MSRTTEEARPYLKLLLDRRTPQKQVRALLDSASPLQTKALSEIVANVLAKNITVDPKSISNWKRLEKLTSKKGSIVVKQRLIYKYSNLILKLLNPIRDDLEKKLLHG